MTKEDLENRFIELFNLTEGFTAKDFKFIIDDFFSSNVVIPKGGNTQAFFDGEWNDIQDYEYRIKPSEPVWEYLWYSARGTTTWATDEEAKFVLVNEWYKASETKRERR